MVIFFVVIIVLGVIIVGVIVPRTAALASPVFAVAVCLFPADETEARSAGTRDVIARLTELDATRA